MKRKKSKSPAKVKAQKKGAKYIRSSRYSQQPSGNKTPAWRDMQSYSTQILRRKTK